MSEPPAASRPSLRRGNRQGKTKLAVAASPLEPLELRRHHRLRHLCSGVLLRKGSFERGAVGTYEKQGHETISPLYACDDSDEEGPRTCMKKPKERCSSVALE